MWIMIVMSSYLGNHISYDGTTATPISITSVEFSSRERCITAATFTKQQPKIYNAFCVQK